MPYTESNVPSYVPKSKAKRWAAIWNSSYEQKKKEGKSDKEAEEYAFSVASGVTNKKFFKFGTERTGFTNGGSFGPFECGHCMFFDKLNESLAFCGNPEVDKDPGVNSDQYGNKIVNFTDCCNEYYPVNLSKGLVMLEQAVKVTKALDEFNIFCPLVKVDVKKREVWGVVTAETVDRDNEICDYDSTIPYYKQIVEDMSKASEGKNIMPLRAMHGLIAAGKGIDIKFRDDAKEVYMGFKVVDDVEWKKVQEGVYTGFSQGGRYIKRWKDGEYMRYTAQPSEVSLVDIPCLPTATFEYVKTDGSSEIRKFVATSVTDIKKAEGSLGQAEGEIPSTTKTPEGDPGKVCTCSCANCKAGDCVHCLSDEKCQMCMDGKAVKELVDGLTKKEKKRAGVNYLVTEGDYGYLPVSGPNGQPNHKLMGAAWAALFSEGGHRGQKYAGPKKEQAKRKLKQLYARESMDTPTEKAERIDGLAKDWTEEAINNRAYGQLGKGMYTVSRFAEICESLKYLWLSLEFEAQAEGDEEEEQTSESLGQVKESYVGLLDALLAYTEEQIEEEKEHPNM